MEIVDIINSEGRLLKQQDRSVKLKENEYIKSVHIYLITDDNEIFIQQRSPEKKENPNLWEVVGGGIRTCELPSDAALRELKEETGINAASKDLKFMGNIICDKYYVYSYLLKINKKLNIRPQLSEVKNFLFVKIDEIDELINDDRFYSSSYSLFKKYYQKEVMK